MLNRQSLKKFQQKILVLISGKFMMQPVTPLGYLEEQIVCFFFEKRYLTSVPHVAGTAQDMQQAQWMRDRFVDAGLDEVKVVPYEVLLSYPKRGMVNTVSLIDNEGRINFTTAGRQPPLGSSEEFSEEVMHNFNAYSANGVAEVGIYLYAITRLHFPMF